MRNYSLVAPALCVAFSAFGQNVGIGTNTPNGRLQFNNHINNRIVVLNESNNNEHNFFGFGINNFILRYQIADPSQSHVFFAGNAPNATGSNELFRIRGDGNVGIGANNPSFKLDVAGRIRSRGDGGNGTSGIFLNNIDNTGIPAFLGMHQSNEHVGFFGNSGLGWGFVMNTLNGNVGIGTSTPNAPLQFQNTAANRKIVLFEGANNDHQFYGFGINANTLRYQTASFFSDHVFYSGFSQLSSDELLRIKGNGNVGIGNASPTNKLSVSGNADFSGNVGIGNSTPNAPLQFQNVGASRKIVLFEGANNDHQFYGFGINANTLRYQTAGNVADHVFFSAADATTSQELMRIKGNGNIGLGVTDPAFKLDVGARMRIRATPDFTAGLWLNNEANTASSAFAGMRSDTELGFYGQTGTFGWRFYVNTTTGNAFLQGGLTQNSDARLKKDIIPLSNSLEAIQQLSGYSYHWKDAANPDEQIGLLAQEIQKVYPQLVKENEQGTLSVNYSGMVPVLLEAIKEQQKQIEELKKMLMLMNEKAK